MSDEKSRGGGRRRKIRPVRPACRSGHAWHARFFLSGRLAFWQCTRCDKTDREKPPPFEALEATTNCWSGEAPAVTARGRRPPVGTRRWATAEGDILCEGDPSSTHFSCEPLPGLAEAHAYVLRDDAGAVRAAYPPERQQHSPYGDHCTLVRFQVVGRALVRFESHCWADSTYEVPHADEPKRSVVLEGLRPLPTRPAGRSER